MSLKIALLVLSLLSGVNAFAFPEMIRHNYVSCTACHFAPTGGGLLTPYGRTISAELLSTWGSEKEARSFYGALDNETVNSFLHVGGSVRALQFHHENKTVQEGRTIPMQAGLEFVALWKKWTASIFVGKLDKDWKVDPVGTRFYLMYQMLDELTLRAGRFLPAFGLNIPQHNVVTRSSLGFNQGMERNAAEAMWSGEKWNIAWTVSQSLKEAGPGEIETAVSTQVNYILKDSYRLGMSYWLGAGSAQQRQIFGTHVALGFTDKLYLLSELDYQIQERANTGLKKGIYHFTKLGYEMVKGVHLQSVAEFAQSSVDDSRTRIESLGPGLLFYPRPHFEFEGLYTKKKIAFVGEDYEDFAYLMMHYSF